MTPFLRRSILPAAMLVAGLMSNAQTPTIGLLHYEPETSEGYTLFTPDAVDTVYLINNCGEKINEWTFSEIPGMSCYLLNDGSLLRAGKDSLEIRDWDNTLLWSYPTTANGIRQHHDIHPLPNGNILCVVRGIYPASRMISEGRNPANLVQNFWMDRIVELSPVGTHEADIVWEWNFIDHLIQDFDSTKSNFGDVGAHPELLDINFSNNFNIDFTHVNAVFYNAALDQIIVTSRHLSEIYVVDHSTTTLEAAGHSGGNSGMGGDFLWRWGNPQVYRQGGAGGQKLFMPHDAKWVEPGYLDEGKISVFNNGGDGTWTFSSVHLITPLFENGTYQKENNLFIPLDFEWSWNGSIMGTVVQQEVRSGANSLPNGNVTFCQSDIGQVTEITKNGDHLWSYKNPVTYSRIYNQYDTIPSPENGMFRAEKYPGTFPGFTGRDMTPKGIIEDQNSLSESCITATGLKEPAHEATSFVNPVENKRIRFNRPIRANALTITDMKGRVVMRRGLFQGNTLEIDLKPSLYILQLHFNDWVETLKILVR